MSWVLDEFFAGVEEEFGLSIAEGDRGLLDTPGAVVDFVAGSTAPADGMDEAEHRDHVASVVGELMAQSLGVTRYREDSRFIEDLRVR
jgi:hypothetical protein